jgi:Pyruvate/2-oxoacid:ferredoxin oxidoreductase delta subunit
MSIIFNLVHKQIPKLNSLNYKGSYDLIYPNDKSKEGLSVTSVILEYGGGKPTFAAKSYPYMARSMFQVKKSYKDLKKNKPLGKTVVTLKDFNLIKAYALSLGVMDFGVAKIEKDMIFSNHAILYDQAIVFSLEMDKDSIEKAPHKDSGHEVEKSYFELGKIVNKIANYMRSLGYRVQASPPDGGDVNFVTLAKAANLGEIGNIGILISKGAGPRQRLSAIFTDASISELDVNSKEDYSWINDFCEKCQQCVRTCPSQAIFEHASRDSLDKRIDYKKCALPYGTMHGCSICIKVCPFSLHGYDRIKKGYLKSQKK